MKKLQDRYSMNNRETAIYISLKHSVGSAVTKELRKSISRKLFRDFRRSV